MLLACTPVGLIMVVIVCSSRYAAQMAGTMAEVREG